MHIVVLDAYTLNPGDLDWGEFQTLGELQLYDRTPEDMILERSLSAEVLLSNKVPLRAGVLRNLPQLRYIGVTATGYNIIDIAVAQELGITVTHVPDYGTEAVAQHTFALMLELCNQVGLHSQSVREGDWSQSLDWAYTRRPIMELSGKTLGIVGYGKIGQKVAQIARVFGMKVIYHSHKQSAHTPDQYVSLEDLFSQSDFVSLHLPLSPENQGFVNQSLLNKMKTGAYLINTARGGLIHEHDLAKALKNGQIAGAALDVLSQEPPSPDHPLLQTPNTIITPHNAWLAKEARQRLLNITLDNLRAFIRGESKNIVKYL
ncbi:MAG: D-2-hydroxyacid dehydrogenase [Microscillaceae bacterium]|nr:D-2-hydroxyacid dehydrogenase [Microscillaceae bacterium]